MIPSKKGIVRFWRRIAKPETWINPRSLLILVVGVILIEAKGLIIKWVELQLEDYSKSSKIVVEYYPTVRVPHESLNDYGRRNGIGEFDLHLDDRVLAGYFVTRFRIANPSRSTVEKVAMELDLGNQSFSRLIDVKCLVRKPASKSVAFQNGLPSNQWVWPKSPVFLRLQWDPVPESSITIYASMFKDRGFGRVNPVPYKEGERSSLPFAPAQVPYFWHFKIGNENEVGEAVSEGVLTTAHPAFGGETFDGDQGNKVNIAEEKNSVSFLRGRTELIFEPSLDPGCELELYALSKILPGQTVVPFLRMRGAPGVSFEEENSRKQFTAVADDRPFDRTKYELMPEIVSVHSSSNAVLLVWSEPTNSAYSGVKVFRSAFRPVGDYSDVGELIYHGFGMTNCFELKTEVQNQRQEPATNTRLDRFLKAPPGTVSTNNYTNAPSRPLPPENLRASIVQRHCGLLSFLDAKLDPRQLYTYTVYAFDRSGVASYPIQVNAQLDESSRREIRQ